MDAGVAVHDLPAGWFAAATRDGRFFFIDDQQRLTTWVHPVTGRPAQTGLIRDTALPNGWEVAFDDARRHYFVDHVNCVTTYEHPGQFSTGERTDDVHDGEGKAQHSPFRRASSKKNRLSRSSGKAPVAKRDYNSAVTMKGWLYKQEGSVIKQWKKRWCVLVDLCLYCYEADNELQTIASLILPGYRVSSDAKDDSSSHKFAFKVEHHKLKSFHFATDSDLDRDAWVDALTNAATLQNDADDARFILLMLFAFLFCFVCIMLTESGTIVSYTIFMVKFVPTFWSSRLILIMTMSQGSRINKLCNHGSDSVLWMSISASEL